MRGKPGHILPKVEDLPLCGRQVATNEIKEGRLPGTIWSDDAMPFPGLYFKTHVIDCHQSAKLLCEALKDQTRRIHPFPPVFISERLFPPHLLL